MPKIKIDPVPKPRAVYSDKWAKRPVIMRYRAFCDELRLKLGSYKIPARVEMVFGIKMSKSWSLKKKDLTLGKPHQQTPDIDNCVKSVLDALCENDSYVYEIHASKFWAKEGMIFIQELNDTTNHNRV